jgi:tRNA nucleotidyltransferase (CCA-adding enzyme)
MDIEFNQDHPEYMLARQVCETLQKFGHKAWLAGGCVRDALLKVPAADYDVATSATPDEIEKLFPKTVAVGKAFGVIIVVEGQLQIEVATFRQDGEYKDGRRPERITLSTPEEDARRRDFTINALFYDFQSGQVIDFVGGLEDLKAGLLRAVGDPHRRFSEDHLRLLRAVRFVSQLGMKLEEKTEAALTQDVNLITDVSGERLFDEWSKLLRGKRSAEALRIVFEKKFLSALWPQFQFSFRDPAPYVHDWAQSRVAPIEMKHWFSFLFWLETQRGEPWSEDELEGFAERLKFSRILKQNLKAAFHWLHKKNLWDGSVSLGEVLEYSFEPGPFLGIRAQEIFLLTNEAKQVLSQNLKRFHELLAVHQAESPHGLPKSLLSAHDFSAEKAGRAVSGAELGLALKKCYRWQLENPRWSAEQILAHWKQHG